MYPNHGGRATDAPRTENPDAGGAGVSKTISVPSKNDRESSRSDDAAQPRLIGELQANAREIARVTLENYLGHDLVRFHKWYPGGDGEMRPSKGGFALNVRHLPRLAELIAAALETARNSGLLPADDPGCDR